MPAVHFDYDADNRKTHMHDSTGDTYWDYTYDGLHLAHQTTPQGVVNYTYDGDGRRFQMGLAGQSANWVNTYDAGGRLTRLQSPTDGTTIFAYDIADRLTKKTKGSGDYELYGYDVASQMTSLSYYFYSGVAQNYLTYTYDPAGNTKTCDQGFYRTDYSYDGADQLTGEALTGERSPGNTTWGYTYDHNGNRLGQTVNGAIVQSFTYDGHDKLTSGTAYNETDGYDANGNQTSLVFNGTTSIRTYDDEDRLTSISIPGVGTDSFTYNGLGLRVGKSDSTGTYSYVCDGTTPGSPILSDGHAVYTPGLSENRGGVASFYSFDKLGNLWTLDGTSQNQTYYQDTTGFGSYIALLGTNPGGFGFSGGNGCQTDADTGLVLMGHRYYDTRVGRFISQDPVGDGDNWYAYCDNNPVNGVDPSGLVELPPSTDPNDPSDFWNHPEFYGGCNPGDTYRGWTWTGTGWQMGPYTPPAAGPTGGGGASAGSGAGESGGGGSSGGGGGNSGGGDSNPGLFDGVGGAFGVGFSAVGSALSGGLWNGGAARHDPSFGISLTLANIGVAAGTAAFGGGAAAEEVATTGCFTKNTPVQTPSKARPIQTLRKGDLVATRNLQTGKTEYRKVVRTFHHLAHNTITVQFADAKTGKIVDTLTGTPEHPFYAVGRGMTALGKLGIGTLVVTRAGPAVVVHSLVHHHSVAAVLVYNIEVEGDHTYFVGNAGGGEWVHNLCGIYDVLLSSCA